MKSQNHSGKKKLVLKALTSCFVIILFALYFLHILSIPAFIALIAIVLVLFWVIIS